MTNQKERDDRAREFARIALGSRQVSREAWIAACVVAEAALKSAENVTPNEMIESTVDQVLNRRGVTLVKSDLLGELLHALADFGMDQIFATDSAKLRRAKDAYRALRYGGAVRFQLPTGSGLPLPEKKDPDDPRIG